MPKYFFHTDGKRPHIDDVGVELKGDVSAWREGVRYLRHLEDQFEPTHARDQAVVIETTRADEFKQAA